MSLSVANKGLVSMYNMVGGMRNIAFVAGRLRIPKGNSKVAFVQVSGDEATMIPVMLPNNYQIPRAFREFSPVSVKAHVYGMTDGEAGQQIAVLKAIPGGFDFASVLNWKSSGAANRMLEQSFAIRDASRKGEVDLPKLFENRDDRLSESSNTVILAGFVNSLQLERTNDGVGVLTVMLRQLQDESRAIPVRFHGDLASTLADRLEEGSPIQVSGKFGVDVRKVGEPDPETGKHKTIKIPYIRSRSLPLVATSDFITIYPDWARDIRSKATDRRRGSGAVEAASEAGALVEAKNVVELSFEE
jgi:hypothetical protein